MGGKNIGNLKVPVLQELPNMKHMQSRKQNWEVKEKKVVSSIELGSR